MGSRGVSQKGRGPLGTLRIYVGIIRGTWGSLLGDCIEIFFEKLPYEQSTIDHIRKAVKSNVRSGCNWGSTLNPGLQTLSS